MRLVIVTGMSGAGKTAALKMLEDMGFYCVDNMPAEMIPQFAQLCLATKGAERQRGGKLCSVGNRCPQRRRAGTAGGNTE